MSMRIFLILAILMMVAGCGLSSSRPGSRVPPRRQPPSEGPTLEGWEQVEVGGEKGYIQTLDERGTKTYVVYNSQMKAIGAYTDLGRTLRYRQRGEPEVIGDYFGDDPIRALFGVRNITVPVVHSPMPSPLVLEDLEKDGEDPGPP